MASLSFIQNEEIELTVASDAGVPITAETLELNPELNEDQKQDKQLELPTRPKNPSPTPKIPCTRCPASHESGYENTEIGLWHCECSFPVFPLADAKRLLRTFTDSNGNDHYLSEEDEGEKEQNTVVEGKETLTVEDVEVGAVCMRCDTLHTIGIKDVKKAIKEKHRVIIENGKGGVTVGVWVGAGLY